jgi:hypothetical protein
MKKLAPLAGLALALALTGCQAPAQPASTTTPSASESTTAAAAEESSPMPVPSATPKTNDRGQVVKKVGEKAYTLNEAGESDFQMKVTGFDFIKCDGVYAQEMDGYVLAVGVEMETTKDFVGNSSFNDVMDVLLPGAYSWTGYESDGTKMSDLTGGDGIINCFDDGRKLFPEYIGKGEKAKGQVLLNVTTKSGEVAFDPFGFGGWVWEYPEKGATA